MLSNYKIYLVWHDNCVGHDVARLLHKSHIQVTWKISEKMKFFYIEANFLNFTIGITPIFDVGVEVNKYVTLVYI